MEITIDLGPLSDTRHRWLYFCGIDYLVKWLAGVAPSNWYDKVDITRLPNRTARRKEQKEKEDPKKKRSKPKGRRKP